ncbi:hypothetical protein [Actinomadura sp. 21ATH]|uniref:hypothetical protein n=1 Tax=Actinomadura sp. 21ATH TaxID=1735444 RepID=UPI0035C089D2
MSRTPRLAVLTAAFFAGLGALTAPADAGVLPVAEEVETRDDVSGTAVPVTANVLGSACSIHVMSSSTGDCGSTPDEITDLQF